MGPRLFTFLASLAAVVTFAGGNIAIQNWMTPLRLDMTQSRLYTLSDAAEEVARGLTEPVELELVYSRQLAAEYPDIRAHGARVRELLNEIAARSRGKVRMRETDPAPFTREEDRILDAGLEAAPTDTGDPLYFGIIGRNSVDDRIILPYLSPERDGLLEYDLVKLISQLDDPSPPRVGIISAIPGLSGQGKSAPDLYVLKEIARSFDIEQIPNDFLQLPNDLDALLIVHPPELSARQEYVIDQYLLTHGRALIALDPASRSALSTGGRRAQLMSSLGRVETTLGISPLVDVVIDKKAGLPVERMEGARRVVETQPLFIAPPPANMSSTDPVTADLGRPINFGATGRLVAAPPTGAIFTPLIRSTRQAAIISAQTGSKDISPRDLLTEYATIGERQVLAGRLTGELVSAFDVADIPEIDIPEDPIEAALMDLPEEAPQHIERSLVPVEVILLADADIFDDAFYISPDGRAPVADNAAFILNALDNLAGDAALVKLRSRAAAARTMTRVDAMRDEARTRLYDEQALLEARLSETEERLAELRTQGAGGGFLQSRTEVDDLDQAQADELTRFRSEAMDIRRRLRDVERAFRSDIDALEGRIVFFNMWLPAILVALTGFGLVGWRAHKTGR